MRKFKLTNRVALKLQSLDKSVSDAGEDSAAAQTAPEAREDGNTAEETVSFTLRVTSRTDTGLVRRNNQDAVILSPALVGIADGMGGHRCGEIASAGARDGLLRAVENREPSEKALEEAFEEVNLALWNRQSEEEELAGMGTTLTVLWQAGTRMLIGHVGDSRAYLLRDGRLRQITRDHSMVADMVRRGLLTEEQAATHPMRNYITRAVGTEPTIETDVLALERQKGDVLLVYSDGLHGFLSLEEMESLINSRSLDDAADEMIRLTLDRGGRDNVSLVLALEEEAGEDAE